MGAWGDKPFENDAALDWLGELEEHGVEAIRETLSGVAETDGAEYLDVDDGSAAIAAAEIVAAALDGGRAALPKRAVAWLRSSASEIKSSDRERARRAVERVLAPESELRGLWDDAGSESGWHASVGELLERLGGDASSIAPSGERGDAQEDAERLKAVLFTFLKARGLEPTPAQRARILASEDLAELERWVGRAASAPNVDAVLK